MEETLKQQLRKKIIDLKADTPGFYSESYNLIAVMIKLNPDAFKPEIAELLEQKMRQIYSGPSQQHLLSLPKLEQLYFRYKEDPNVRIKSKSKLHFSEIKEILDKVRRDLLFYLALVEDRPQNYDIVMASTVKKELVPAAKPTGGN